MPDLKECYRAVLDDLTGNDNSSIFKGNYDARNGSEEFMHGISTVMEVIADRAGDDSFEDMFLKNMIASQQKAERSTK